MQRGLSYKRPTAHNKARKVAPAHTPDRFETEALGGRLWYSVCQHAAKDIVEEIPLQFGSIEEYLGVFDPLILEEAREGLKADWAESCTAGKLWEVEVVSFEELPDGWCNLKLRAYSGHGALRQACPNNTSVVLSGSRPPARGAVEWAEMQVIPPGKRPAKRQRRDNASAAGSASATSIAGSSGADPDHAGGSDAEGGTGAAEWAPEIVAGIVRRSKDVDLLVQIYPRCSAHAAAADSCCASVLRLLRSRPKRWWLVPAKQLISSQREFEALHHCRQLDSGLLRYILRPQLLEEIGKRFEDPGVRQRMWPQQAAHPAFIGFLQKQYDHTQLEAIEIAACHLGASANENTTLPFVLIQGPPGTGKTHTVKGILNVWHLVAYQRYYDGLIQAAMPQSRSVAAPPRSEVQPQSFLESLNDQGSNVVEAVGNLLQVGTLGQAIASTKPRILVCTPSNAACDELMLRIMTDGFCDGNGNLYRPNVIRVGSEQVNANVRERWVGQMVEAYEVMEQGTWQRRYGELSQRVVQCQREIEVLEMSLARVSGEPQQQEVLAKRLVERHQQQYRYSGELERLEMARDIVWGQREEWRLRDARRNIEASFLTEAEMVFTTLSSTGRQSFRQAAQKAPFQTVLIDEAGQATEVASLQPLMYGAQRVVMVGDPQQLPATILSALAKEVAMERSLFERLQKQGCPVKMLSVQYRMHPEIRQFPSEHFYGGRLLDAPSITQLPDEAFYEHPVLKPYVFFDVARGQEQRRQGGGSVSNQAEAELAACLFLELRTFLINAAQKDPKSVPRAITVGVITPYREQRKVLVDTFVRICGKRAASEVMIETVDSFQGKQLDVIILSCVRAGNSGGLGFVTDVRRMNVAITRAKRALWVLGSITALRTNQEWQALISDAEQRGVVIEEADARELFPDQPHWAREDEEAVRQAEHSTAAVSDTQQAQRGGQQAPKLLLQQASQGKGDVRDLPARQEITQPIKSSAVEENSVAADAESAAANVIAPSTIVVAQLPVDPRKRPPASGQTSDQVLASRHAEAGSRAAFNAADAVPAQAATTATHLGTRAVGEQAISGLSGGPALQPPTDPRRQESQLQQQQNVLAPTDFGDGFAHLQGPPVGLPLQAQGQLPHVQQAGGMPTSLSLEAAVQQQAALSSRPLQPLQRAPTPVTVSSATHQNQAHMAMQQGQPSFHPVQPSLKPQETSGYLQQPQQQGGMQAQQLQQQPMQDGRQVIQLPLDLQQSLGMAIQIVQQQQQQQQMGGMQPTMQGLPSRLYPAQQQAQQSLHLASLPVHLEQLQHQPPNLSIQEVQQQQPAQMVQHTGMQQHPATLQQQLLPHWVAQQGGQHTQQDAGVMGISHETELAPQFKQQSLQQQQQQQQVPAGLQRALLGQHALLPAQHGAQHTQQHQLQQPSFLRQGPVDPTLDQMAHTVAPMQASAAEGGAAQRAQGTFQQYPPPSLQQQQQRPRRAAAHAQQANQAQQGSRSYTGLGRGRGKGRIGKHESRGKGGRGRGRGRGESGGQSGDDGVLGHGGASGDRDYQESSKYPAPPTRR